MYYYSSRIIISEITAMNRKYILEKENRIWIIRYSQILALILCISASLFLFYRFSFIANAGGDSGSVSVNKSYKTRNLEPKKASYKRGTFSEGVTESHIPYKVYTPSRRSNKVVFVFGGKTTIGKDCGKMSYYMEIKNKNIVPNYNVVFVQKDSGSWKQYSQEDIGSMIDEIVKDLKGKELYYVGFSQGVYNAQYIATTRKKWHGCLFVDGAGDMKWVKRYFKVSAFVAGYVKDAYKMKPYFDYYYEPIDMTYATHNKKVHELVFDWAVLPDRLFINYNTEGIINRTSLDAVSVLVNEL